MRLRARGVAVAVALALGACGGGDDDGGDDGRLTVATSLAPITSIVAVIAGDRAEVRGIVPEGTSSHTFEPKPSVAELLSTADVVIMNGLQLEKPTLELAEANVDDGVEVVQLGDRVASEDEWIFDFSFPLEGGKPNPHLWTDPKYVVRYAAEVRDVLVELDPGGEATYDAGLDLIERQVDDLTAAMEEAFATIPEGGRKLLTYHDAYAYFAESYAFEVIGAIQVSDFEDPTPREIADLVEQIEASGVRAIFGSEVFPSPVLDQLAKEAAVEYVDDLRDDDLPGEPGDAEHSLLGLLRFNYATITDALGGDGSAIAALELPDTDDRATYPQ
jgi:ABC-type Zn uptake system ZnuABC Zn-binding protein ZnuA